MCRIFYSRQPVCRCIKVEPGVLFCSLYSGIPENKDKLKSRPKLVTGHSKGLDHLFNGVNYVSADQTLDLEPKGLECEEIHYLEILSKRKRGPCPLCDNPEALKFLKAKGIEYDPVAVIDLSNFQRAGKRRAEDTGQSSSGGPSKASRGMPLDKLAGSSDEMEGVEYGASQARGRERSRAEGTRAEGTRAEGTRAEGYIKYTNLKV
ncbi:hypothetical protein BDR22DRAFT_819092 [Usnea florida]